MGKHTADVDMKIHVTAESMSETDVLKAGIKEMEEEIARLQSVAVADDAAQQTYQIFDAMVRAGFSKKRAFKLLKIQMKGAMPR